MNRSLLIAICDFMIISLLSTGTFQQAMDMGNGGDGRAPGVPLQEDILDTLEMVINEADNTSKDLTDKVSSLEGEISDAKQVEDSLNKNLADMELKNQKLENLIKSSENELAIQASKVIDVEMALKDEQREKEVLLKELEDEKEKSDSLNKNLENTKSMFSETMKTLEKLSDENKQQAEQRVAIEKNLEKTREDLQGKLIAVENLAAREKDLLSENNRLSKQLQLKELQEKESRQKIIDVQQETLDLSKQLLEKDKELANVREDKIKKEEELKKLNLEIQFLQEMKDKAQAEAEELTKKSTMLEEKSIGMAESIAEIAKETALKKDPLSVNTIYSNYSKHLLKIRFHADGKWLLSQVSYDNEREAVPVVNGDVAGFFLFYKKTPLKWMHFGTNLQSLRCEIVIGGEADRMIHVKTIRVMKKDPRIVFVEVDKDLLEKYIETEKDIALFDSAVLINDNNEKYGSFNWQQLKGDEGFFKVPTTLTSRIFGDFSPGSGDAVLSRNSKMLGIMVTKDKAMYLNDWDFAEVFDCKSPIDEEIHKKYFKVWSGRLNAVLFPAKYNS